MNADQKLERFAAETVHWVLYGALVIVPLSGWISHAAAAGFAPIWWPFGQGLPLVPKARTSNICLARCMDLSQSADRRTPAAHRRRAQAPRYRPRRHPAPDAPGDASHGPLPAQRHSSAPFLTALAICGRCRCLVGGHCWAQASRRGIEVHGIGPGGLGLDGRGRHIDHYRRPVRLNRRQAALPIGPRRSPLTKPCKSARRARSRRPFPSRRSPWGRSPVRRWALISLTPTTSQLRRLRPISMSPPTAIWPMARSPSRTSRCR